MWFECSWCFRHNIVLLKLRETVDMIMKAHKRQAIYFETVGSGHHKIYVCAYEFGSVVILIYAICSVVNHSGW